MKITDVTVACHAWPKPGRRGMSTHIISAIDIAL